MDTCIWFCFGSDGAKGLNYKLTFIGVAPNIVRMLLLASITGLPRALTLRIIEFCFVAKSLELALKS